MLDRICIKIYSIDSKRRGSKGQEKTRRNFQKGIDKQEIKNIIIVEKNTKGGAKK